MTRDIDKIQMCQECTQPKGICICNLTRIRGDCRHCGGSYHRLNEYDYACVKCGYSPA